MRVSLWQVGYGEMAESEGGGDGSEVKMSRKEKKGQGQRNSHGFQGVSEHSQKKRRKVFWESSESQKDCEILRRTLLNLFSVRRILLKSCRYFAILLRKWRVALRSFWTLLRRGGKSTKRDFDYIYGAQKKICSVASEKSDRGCRSNRPTHRPKKVLCSPKTIYDNGSSSCGVEDWMLSILNPTGYCIDILRIANTIKRE